MEDLVAVYAGAHVMGAGAVAADVAVAIDAWEFGAGGAGGPGAVDARAGGAGVVEVVDAPIAVGCARSTRLPQMCPGRGPLARRRCLGGRRWRGCQSSRRRRRQSGDSRVLYGWVEVPVGAAAAVPKLPPRFRPSRPEKWPPVRLPLWQPPTNQVAVVVGEAAAAATVVADEHCAVGAGVAVAAGISCTASISASSMPEWSLSPWLPQMFPWLIGAWVEVADCSVAAVLIAVDACDVRDKEVASRRSAPTAPCRRCSLDHIMVDIVAMCELGVAPSCCRHCCCDGRYCVRGRR